MSLSRTLILEIMAAVDLLDAEPAIKHKFCELVRQVGAAHGQAWVKREERLAFAGELLRRRVSRPTVRDRLIALYGVSRGQAYRIIEAALKLSQNQPWNETTSGFNERTD